MDEVTAALDRLVAAGTLTPDQADAVRHELGRVSRPAPPPSDDRDSSWTTVLAEVAGYVGAAFVFAAAIVLAAPRWGDLPPATQAITLGVSALLLAAAAGWVAAGTPGGWTVHPGVSGPRRRLVGALVLVAGAMATSTTATLTDGPRQEGLTVLTALAVWGVGYLACRGILLHIATAGAATWAVFAVADWATSEPDATLVGLLTAAIGVGWGLLAVWGVLDERRLGLAAAGAIVFVGAEEVVVDGGAERGLGYLLLLGLAVAGLAGYAVLRDVVLLVVGAAALAVVVPQAVTDYSNGALGAAGALLFSGLTIVGAAVLGLRLRERSPHLTP